jgi:hypothetical protein
MKASRSICALTIVAALLSACSGGAGPTQQPAAATQTPGGAGTETQVPGATDGGGGGGGQLDTSHGKAHVDISGSVTKSLDLGFQPILSHFGGTDATVIYFVPADAQGALAVTLTSGQLNAVFTSTDASVTGIECTATNLKADATSASGSFDCPKNVVVLASGASSQNAGFKGTFEARG